MLLLREYLGCLQLPLNVDFLRTFKMFLTPENFGSDREIELTYRDT